MEPGDALRPPAGGGDGRHRQGRGVGGEHAVRRDNGLELPEQAPLDLQILDDGFDDDVAVPERRRVPGHGVQACLGVSGRLGRHAPLRGEVVEGRRNRGPRLIGGAVAGIGEQHPDPRGGGDLGDAAAHGARTDDAQTECRCVGVEHDGCHPQLRTQRARLRRPGPSKATAL